MKKPETVPGVTILAGSDASPLARAIVIRGAIDYWLKTWRPVNRFYTPTKMAAAAEQITGKTYKRGTIGLTQASKDLAEWIARTKAAMPVKSQAEQSR
jgi:hypothetical protein